MLCCNIDVICIYNREVGCYYMKPGANNSCRSCPLVKLIEVIYIPFHYNFNLLVVIKAK